MCIARQIQGRGNQNKAGGSAEWGERTEEQAGVAREREGVRGRRRSSLDEGARGKVSLWDWDLV